MKRLTTEFVDNIIKNKHACLMSSYTTNKTPISIKCNMCNRRSNVLFNNVQKRKYACPKCSKIKTSKMENFRETQLALCKSIISSKGGTLLSKTYTNAHQKMKIKCSFNHIFEMSYNCFQTKKQWCPKCSGRKQHTLQTAQTIIRRKNGKLLSGIYKNAHEKLKIQCENGHIFLMRLNNIQNGQWCMKCFQNRNTSFEEKEICAFLKNNGIKRIIKNTRDILSPKELDIYLPEHKVAIEYCGLFWHSNKFREKKYHSKKYIECKEKGIRLITIFQDEWEDKKEICKNRILNILGLIQNKIYARKCIFKKISLQEADSFLNQYHIQGSGNNTLAYGLFYESELVSCMTFSKPNIAKGKSKSGVWELNRFCSSKNVIGGASKLFKNFIKQEDPISVFSYCDLRWGNGKIYDIIGMEFDSFTPLNYFYIVNNKRKHRYNFTKHKLVKMGYNKKKTEKQIMHERGINHIYDCGNAKYTWEK